MIFCLTLALCGSLTTSLAAEPGAGIASQGVDRSCHKVGLVTMKIIASGLKPGRKFSGSGYAVRSGIPSVSQSFNKSF